MTQRQIKLGAFFLLPGNHNAAWRHEASQKEHILNIDFAIEQAKIAEQGKFDAIFLADRVGVASLENKEIFEQSGQFHYEPITFISALATVTKNIGLVATVSTSFNEPYNVARKFASIDLISKGRTGWNVVTSSNEFESRNFHDQPHLLHEKRYERADEFVDVVKKLWNSAEADALVYDKETGRVVDSSKVHAINHKGKHFSVAGPLNVLQSPQGHPVIVQAGSSEPGKELAARTAEAIFTAWQTLEEAQAFYRDVKGRLAKYGRQPEELVVMPGVVPIVGRTEEEAIEKKRKLDDLISIESGIARLSSALGLDFSQYDVDGPFPLAELPSVEEFNGNKSRYALLLRLVKENNYTIRQLCRHTASGRGHWEVVGTPEQIADQLQLWFENEAADGFNVLVPTYPEGLKDIVELVIPELQRRGLFRKEYEGTTLREHLGLKRPENIYAMQHVKQ